MDTFCSGSTLLFIIWISQFYLMTIFASRPLKKYLNKKKTMQLNNTTNEQYSAWFPPPTVGHHFTSIKKKKNQ